jgi:amidohydrolase
MVGYLPTGNTRQCPVVATRVTMTVLDDFRQGFAPMIEWRRDFHRHPELGFEEHRTAARIAELLTGWGLSVRSGVGGTGVIATLAGSGNNARSIGFRAEMDALPMAEKTNLPHRSLREGVFHGCGHDGHAATLLGAANYLARRRELDGTVHFIFQPAEETLKGSLAMLHDGLLSAAPMDEVYALHNMPQRTPGSVGVRSGTILSGADGLRIVVRGVGAHGAQPQNGIDPIVIAAELIGLLQTTISRSLDPLDAGVVTIGTIQGGTAPNVIPDEVVLTGTIRSMSKPGRALLKRRVAELCIGLGAAFGVSVECDISDGCPPTINHPEQVAVVEAAARRVVGPALLDQNCAPMMASEDFSFMLEERPGAFFFVGQDGLGCHHPSYEFDEDVMSIGAAMFVEIARERLGRRLVQIK